MIEEIQALMPLLERISDGAIWAFAIYMAVKLVTVIIWPVALVWAAIVAIPRIVDAAKPEKSRKVDLYNLHHRNKDVAEYIGDYTTLMSFLNWARRNDETRYLHESDLEAIMDGKRAPRNGGAK